MTPTWARKGALNARQARWRYTSAGDGPAGGGETVEVGAGSRGPATPMRKGGAVVGLLWLLFFVLLVLWLVGFSVNWGAFIWLLLVAAVVILVLNLITAVTRGRWY